MFNSRLGCSSISFRHQDLPTALRTIAGLGFEEIDLGALPGVCDHVPYDLDAEAVAAVTAEVVASGLRVRSVNGDIGDLNAVLDAAAQSARDRHLDALLTLAAGTGAKALVLPCGALGHEPVRSLDEDLDTVAAQLIARQAAGGRSSASNSGPSHCTSCGSAGTWSARNCWPGGWPAPASGSSWTSAISWPPARTRWTTSSATRAGSPTSTCAMPCRGTSTSASATARPISPPAWRALAAVGYTGHFSLELETRDVTHEERPAAAAKAASFITDLI